MAFVSRSEDYGEERRFGPEVSNTNNNNNALFKLKKPISDFNIKNAGINR